MNIITDVLKLFYINKQRNSWNGWLDDKDTWVLVNELSIYENFRNIFDWELTADFFPLVFNQLKLPQKTNYTEEDARDFLQLLYNNLVGNISDYWIILPLVKASISESIIVSENVMIITGSREEKIEKISSIIDIDIKETYSRFEHTEKSRSPYFLSHPLLLLKKRHQLNVIDKLAVSVAYYSMNMLKVLYYAFIFPEHQHSKLLFLKHEQKESPTNHHVVIQCKSSSNWRHRPLYFEYDCNFELDWLQSLDYKKYYIGLIDLLDKNKYRDELTSRFLRAIRFFVKAIDVDNNHSFFEDETDKILYLNIAVESILVRNQEERNKSRKIKGRLSRLGHIEDIDFESSKLLIEKMINARGSYVHEGNSYIPSKRFKDSSKDEEEDLNDIELFTKIVARFLTHVPEYVNKYLRRSDEAGQNIFDLWLESFKE